ncbi:hypothetical protein [Mycobacteroides chelonae]|uniref:hypothetical protein n=1 Tax=Mycobacteroides chelonae TaxID=1774 RepID=UPI0008A980EA|nr:hypothetical protein [Mycobacteroides chelonae]OHU64965.1 hypothetical protein BKG85_05010 [Mycobacteroides chelonae]
MLTGVSLLGIDAKAVVLRNIGQVYVPLTLGITGTYDRKGSIDDVRDDLNTQLVLQYFTAEFQRGRFAAVDCTRSADTDASSIPDWSIEDLLRLIERTSTRWSLMRQEPATTLLGDPVVHALIAQPIWDALAASARARHQALGGQFDLLFRGSIVTRDIYAGHVDELRTAVAELAVVDEFIAKHCLRWVSTGEPSQRYPNAFDQHHGQMAELLNHARQRHLADPAILAGLKAYERETDWLLKEYGQ